MPTPVSALFEATGVAYCGTVRWGQLIPSTSSGVYVVSMGQTTDRLEGCCAAPLISESAVADWLCRAANLTLDGQGPPSANALAARLEGFWLPDENIIYIGKATSLRTRVGGYYKTPLGEPRPHAGGHWIKTLANLPRMFVHYGTTEAIDEHEGAMLRTFTHGVSEHTGRGLRDPERPFPFANLEYPPGTRKRHGLKNQCRAKRAK